jgi:hypothetical protein
MELWHQGRCRTFWQVPYDIIVSQCESLWVIAEQNILASGAYEAYQECFGDFEQEVEACQQPRKTKVCLPFPNLLCELPSHAWYRHKTTS